MTLFNNIEKGPILNISPVFRLTSEESLFFMCLRKKFQFIMVVTRSITLKISSNFPTKGCSSLRFFFKFNFLVPQVRGTIWAHNASEITVL
jgi:hypothetical protein